jgi:hypothetical protein
MLHSRSSLGSEPVGDGGVSGLGDIGVSGVLGTGDLVFFGIGCVWQTQSAKG